MSGPGWVGEAEQRLGEVFNRISPMESADPPTNRVTRDPAYEVAEANLRWKVKTPGQNGSRERGFGSLKYERLFLEEIPDAIDLAAHVEHYRVEYNTVRPHENLSWNRPIEVHLGYADPKTPNFPEPQNLPSP